MFRVSKMAAPMFWSMAATATLFKLLLVPSYRSTDFEVHRNWMAITYSKPIKEWYFESTSEWTLDYPPFFAWLEYGLSQVAQYFDRDMLSIDNLSYTSPATILFQRLSVITTDLIFIYVVKQFSSHFPDSKKKVYGDQFSMFNTPAIIRSTLLVANAGLFFVDHFQYNGFLTGLLLLSILRMYEGRHFEGAFWFAVLLNFKHIYLYVAPAYFIYLLRCFCFQSLPDGRIRWSSFSVVRLLALGCIVVMVFLVSFGPFLYMGQLPQVLSRLFPVKRGLCHAYWAPNFWALYNVADKALTVVGIRVGVLSPDMLSQAVMTGGLVQEFQHTVLPSITPLVTIALTGASMLPALFILWWKPKGPASFVRCLVLCAFCSFMFCWHVHEKAIILIIIPLSLLCLDKKRDGQVFLILSTCGHYSLFPLIFTQAEIPIRLCIMLAYTLYAFTSLGNIFNIHWRLTALPLLSTVESLYVIGLIPLELYTNVVHHFLDRSNKYPFLPLMLISVYCAVGVTYCWLKFYYLTLFEKSTKVKQK